MEEVQESHGVARTEFLNILLLGPTGVGKSTFINALCNYITYGSFDEACGGEIMSLIFSEFKVSAAEGDDEEYVTEKISVGVPDEAERAPDGQTGSSCTQIPKAYVFPYGEGLSIRIIDTPGMGDTRGVDVDTVNMTNVMSFLSQYEMLHAVCILLKPNEERLTNSLRYAIIKLLEKLDKKASANIIFCFTNSRNTNFRPGSTLQRLEEMLRPKNGTNDNIRLDIDLKVKTMYFFDNEAFRFQAMQKHGMIVDEQEREDCQRSWKQSNKEAERLITYIRNLEPHRIQDTLALDRVRSLNETIQEPLRKLTAAAQNNLQKIRENRDLLRTSDGAIRDYADKLVIDKQFEETVPLPNPRTVCTEPSCTNRICHDKCSSTENVFKKLGSAIGSVAKNIGEMDLDWKVSLGAKSVENCIGTPGNWVLCSKLNLLTSRCNVCNCPNDKHIRTHHEMRTVTRKVENAAIRKVLEKTRDDAKQKEEILEILEKDERALKGENDLVLQAAVYLAAYLEQNSIITYHSAVPNYYKEQIKLMQTQGNYERVYEFEALLQKYEQQVAEHKKSIHNFNDPGFTKKELVTVDTVEQCLQRLYELPINGPSLKRWVEGVENKFTLAFNHRGELVYNADTARTSHAASSSGGSHPTSRFTKMFRGGNHG